MENELKERVVLLEHRQTTLEDLHKEMKIEHKEEMNKIRDAVENLAADFDQIIELVKSIKWWLIGAVSFLVIEQVGIAEFVKKLVIG